jgi:hypothetical protein
MPPKPAEKKESTKLPETKTKTPVQEEDTKVEEPAPPV